MAAYLSEGAASLAHGNRGRQPSNAIPDGIRKQVLTLATTKYHGFNHTHFSEVLTENEGLELSRCTVRSILMKAGIKSPRSRRAPRHRTRRERMPQAGMLVQVDGSYHDWLEGRGPWLTLLLAVDDATVKVAYALLRKQEDTYGYFLLFEGLIRQEGIPLAVYHDRHAALGGSNRKATGQPKRTQVGRALEELGVNQVFAKSPEAKGRVERAAGTFQDRLVSELRLAQADNLTEANRVLREFLPRFNERFGISPRDPESAYRSLPSELNLEALLCFKHTYRVARDNTVKHQSHTLQLLPERGQPSLARAWVEIQERLDGRLIVYRQGQVIPTQEAPPRANCLRRAQGAGGETAPTIRGTQEQVPPRARATVAPDSVDRLSRDRLPGRHRDPAYQGQGPTVRQQLRWNAIQAAREQGLSMRGKAQTLGISRNTVVKYLRAGGPPTALESLASATD